jgi:hypothetical protein
VKEEKYANIFVYYFVKTGVTAIHIKRNKYFGIEV